MWQNMKNLPPPEQETEENGVERVNLDPNDRYDHSEDDADVHPRKTRSQTTRQISSFNKHMTEEEENIFWVKHKGLAKEHAQSTCSKR